MVIKHFLSTKLLLLFRKIRGNMRSNVTESKKGSPLRHKITLFSNNLRKS